MILERVLEHLAEHRVAGPVEIARALGASADAVRGMLATLERRGLVHRARVKDACGSSCRQCAQADSELYGPGPATHTVPVGLACPASRRG